MIVKVCKKHGELKIEDTYQLKTKIGTLIRMCSICKKGYRNDWAKLNPEKVKIMGQNAKIKSLNELANGTLKKTCPRHGELLVSHIRIDARGSKICRLCSNEIKRKSIKKVDPTGEKYRKWLYSDRERVQRYYANDYPKKLKRQMKAYYKIKENDPEKYKMKERQKLDCAKKARLRLDDSYISTLLKTIRYGGKKNRFYHFLKDAKFPQELIELVKAQIKLRRAIRNKKCLK